MPYLDYSYSRLSEHVSTDLAIMSNTVWHTVLLIIARSVVTFRTIESLNNRGWTVIQHAGDHHTVLCANFLSPRVCACTYVYILGPSLHKVCSPLGDGKEAPHQAVVQGKKSAQ